MAAGIVFEPNELTQPTCTIGLPSTETGGEGDSAFTGLGAYLEAFLQKRRPREIVAVLIALVPARCVADSNDIYVGPITPVP